MLDVYKEFKCLTCGFTFWCLTRYGAWYAHKQRISCAGIQMVATGNKRTVR